MTSHDNSNGNGNGNSLKLYYWYTSFYSQRIVMALYEKRVPFKTRIVNLIAMEQYEPWFLRLNPRAEIPVLTDGVKVIPDSVRIMEYLEDNFSNGDFGRLTPKEKGNEESKKIQKYRDLLESLPIDVITYGSISHSDLLDNPKPPFTPVIIKKMTEVGRNRGVMIRNFAERVPEFREKLLEKAREVEEGRFKQVQNREAVEKVISDLDNVMQNLEEELASHTDEQSEWWLCGPLLSIADIDLAILLNRLFQLGHESRYWAHGKRPYLEAYWERIRQRSSFKRATYFSANAMRLTMLRGALRGSKGIVASLTAAAGLAALSYILYKKLHKS